MSTTAAVNDVGRNIFFMLGYPQAATQAHSKNQKHEEQREKKAWTISWRAKGTTDSPDDDVYSGIAGNPGEE